MAKRELSADAVIFPQFSDAGCYDTVKSQDRIAKYQLEMTNTRSSVKCNSGIKFRWCTMSA